MNENWWPPGKIKYTRSQVLWVIKNLPYLREGYWPPNPAGSGYVDSPISKRKSGAYFETPILIAVDIQTRLERCGLDGLILESIEGWDKTVASLSQYLHIPEYSINKRCKRALSYVASGPDVRWHTTKKRRGETYQQFKLRKRHPIRSS